MEMWAAFYILPYQWAFRSEKKTTVGRLSDWVVKSA